MPTSHKRLLPESSRIPHHQYEPEASEGQGANYLFRLDAAQLPTRLLGSLPRDDRVAAIGPQPHPMTQHAGAA